MPLLLYLYYFYSKRFCYDVYLANYGADAHGNTSYLSAIPVRCQSRLKSVDTGTAWVNISNTKCTIRSFVSYFRTEGKKSRCSETNGRNHLQLKVAKSSKMIRTSDMLFLRGRADGFGNKSKVDPGHYAMVKLMFLSTHSHL
jgi:hypothetical protein